MVLQVTSVAAFDEAMQLSNQHLVVVDFFATWCRPCTMVAPAFERLSDELPDVKFYKVDVDILSNVAQREAVRAMPTFKLYRNGQCQETIQGGNLQLVRAAIDRLRPPPPLIEEVLELASSADNPETMEAGRILVRIADNILREPLNQKYRRLKVCNKIVSEKLLPVDGAMQCLIAMGFHDNEEDCFVLDPEVPLDRLRLVRAQIEKILLQGHGLASGSSEARSPSPPEPPRAASPVPPASSPSPSPQSSSVPPESPMEIAAFRDSLQRSMDLVQVYERPQLQEKARRLMDWQELSTRVDTSNTRMLVWELLRWFKDDFFSWMDAPDCRECGLKCSAIGMGQPTLSEAEGWASTIELYQCPRRHAVQRFPRFNHPDRLLDTRTGRCGEWANAFSLILRAAGVRTRYVHDWTDHVWCEVFMDGRWIHCDPCEKALDKPLVYECGWGKKLTYIIAFSRDDIQDVTWRYTRQPEEVRQRRTKVPEAWLVSTIVQFRRALQSSMSEAELKLRQEEVLKELVEFLTIPREPAADELSGRQSGSEAWRLSRGEMGHTKKGQCIRPLPEELKAKRFELRYSCVLDEYERPGLPSGAAERKSKGWASCVESSTNIQRKRERDWKMVYLSRIEGSPAEEKGSISWTIDLTATGRCVSVVKVLSNGAEFEGGEVKFTVCGDGDRCASVKGFYSDDKTFVGCHKITLTATLSGGKGENAFQHAQLFRQHDTDTQLHPLDFVLELKEDEMIEDVVD